MQVPKRKPGIYTHLKPDPNITQNKFEALNSELDRLKKIVRPRLAEEARTHAAQGDFSENVEYSIAKGKLRGVNQRILDIEDHLKRASVIPETKDNQQVSLGHTVTIEVDGIKKKYQILGSSETSPAKGVISHNSPLGCALMNREPGEELSVRLASKLVHVKILKIE
jgi:transcription elongation factor GreA